MQENQTKQDNKRFLSESIDFNYKMLVRACKFTTLYLLKKYGPLQFLFEDPLQRQHRVKLGQRIVCSCHEGNLGHCIHSLYILIRIYKLPQNHKFVFTSSYSEQDLEQLTNLGTAVKQIIKPLIKSQAQIIAKVSQNLIVTQKTYNDKKIQNTQNNKIKSANSLSLQEWPTFDEQAVCSICYDKIQNQSPIIDCRGCKNYFHTKCLKVWVTQKNKQNVEISCPMCRREFQTLIEQRIKKMQKYYIQYHQSHGINCSSCNKDILIKLYKCLLCEKYYLCTQCYLKWEHKNHDKFIGKESKRAEWVVSQRSQYNINKLNANLQYFKKFNTNGSEIKELMGSNYQQFISNYSKKPTLLQHILSAITDVQKEVHKTYKKLDFTEQDIVCCLCKKKKIVGMRRMNCKHFIDEKCLKFILQSSIKQCPIDKKYILPGLSDVNLKLE